MAPRRKANKDIKRYIKFLSIVKKPEVTKRVLTTAPDSVIKVIANAALNAANGPVKIPPALKKQFRSHRPLVTKLIDKKRKIKAKRQVLVQRGGLSFLPLLLSTVLGSLGPLLFNNK